MNITNIDIRLVPLTFGNGHLRAYASVELDRVFVVHSMRIIEASGRLFVSMPSKKTTIQCTGCCKAIDFDSHFCPKCGAPQESAPPGSIDHRTRDIAHPTCGEFRAVLERAVLQRYREELSRQSPGSSM